jgi:hypothetical protein
MPFQALDTKKAKTDPHLAAAIKAIPLTTKLNSRLRAKEREEGGGRGGVGGATGGGQQQRQQQQQQKEQQKQKQQYRQAIVADANSANDRNAVLAPVHLHLKQVGGCDISLRKCENVQT